MVAYFNGLTLSGALLISMGASPAFAQNQDWTYSVSGYLWANDTTVTADTPFGQVSSELSFSDAIEDLEFAFMGAVEARNGHWGIIGDLLYFKLSADGTPPGPVFSSAEATTQISVVSGYAVYRVYEDPSVSFDLGGGFRAVWGEVDANLIGATTVNLNESNDWVDPVLAARLRMKFNEDWFGTLWLDAGGTNDTTSWQALATVGYNINDAWSVQAGYRHLEVEWDNPNGNTSLEFSGPIIGVNYRF
jgi:opacity protein-like surface antigen